MLRVFYRIDKITLSSFQFKEFYQSNPKVVKLAYTEVGKSGFEKSSVITSILFFVETKYPTLDRF